jgi:hypothetical protein
MVSGGRKGVDSAEELWACGWGAPGGGERRVGLKPGTYRSKKKEWGGGVGDVGET